MDNLFGTDDGRFCVFLTVLSYFCHYFYNFAPDKGEKWEYDRRKSEFW